MTGPDDDPAAPAAPGAQPSVEALLFDLGGVVFGIDFDRAVRSWEQAAGVARGALAGRFTMDDAYERHERGQLDAEAYLASVGAALGVPLTHEQLATGWNDIYLGPLPGMPELVARAGAVLPTYAFTNSNHLHRSVWGPRYAAELAAFRHVFNSADLGLRKPEPAAFHHVADAIGVPLDRILFFDDTAENTEAATALGLQTVLVDSPHAVADALAPLGIT